MRFLSWLLFFLAGVFLFSSCDSSSKEEEDPTPTPSGPSSGTTSYLALGDSYTIGQGVAAAERWPVYLASYLKADGIDVGNPRIIAQTGWTTANLIQRVKAENLAGGYGLVSLMIGVNNQYQGRSTEEFRTQFKELLAISINLAQKDPKNVLVLTIPDWGATPFGAGANRAAISEEIMRFNAIIKAEASAAGVTVIEVYDLSLQVQGNPSLLAPDNLHYSGLMHQLWAQRALPEAKKALAN